ncbi:uncharacterized protein GGS22DRAFT_183494 [Annulohypoxylon maeteangense]|uniref:uncharacterized protein n=1 Tax=Annulohypoxylon maeteangense TaxID=1927788 RepID=UPI00200805E9|nr:uncharacterized protein GGS22DRAFT_183494 [Annulohypoxylon maeteangense]KAI0890148.1 hypothetical protein GGS22DRAFT_183494 [Annulohypoxylon maeteangense]
MGQDNRDDQDGCRHSLSYVKGSKDHNTEREDSSPYTGIYPRSSPPGPIPRVNTQLKLISHMDSLNLGSNRRGQSPDISIVLKCIQKNVKRPETESTASRKNRKKRTEEWLLDQGIHDIQPGSDVARLDTPSCFPRANATLTPLAELEEAHSSEGTSHELDQQSDCFSDDLKSISDYLGTKATSTSRFEDLEEVEVSCIPNEQEGVDEKYQQLLPSLKGLRIVEGLTVQQFGANPTQEGTSSSRRGQGPASFGFNLPGGSRSTSNKKRKLGENNNGKSEDDNHDDSDEDGSRRLRARHDKGKNVESALLACPYFKHDSRKYSGKEWKRCRGPGWDSVRRMKEHLYSRHRQPEFVCRRCGNCFAIEDNLNDHSRQTKPCEVRLLPPMCGFDSTQEKLLRSRKREFTSMSEFDKWKLTYTILFPDVPKSQIPSPYYGHIGSVSDVLSDFEEFVQTEISGDFRATLEHGLETNFNLTEDRSKQKAIEWLKDIQVELVRSFQARCWSRASLPTTSTNPGPSEVRTLSSEMTPPSFEGSQLLTEVSTTLTIESIIDDDVYTERNEESLGYFGGHWLNDNTYPFLVEQSHDERPPKPADSAYWSMESKEDC